MLTNVIVVLLVIVLLVFIVIYKKEMIIKMFILSMSAPANEFTQQLEQTADSIIRRIEEETTQLELLLEEAETKIGMLSHQVEHANKIIAQLVELQEKPNVVDQPKIEIVAAESSNASVLNAADDDVTCEEIQPATEVTDADENQHTELINIEKYRHIIAMADQGYTVTEIAKATGMGKGEIMLLLQLNKK